MTAIQHILAKRRNYQKNIIKDRFKLSRQLSCSWNQGIKYYQIFVFVCSLLCCLTIYHLHFNYLSILLSLYISYHPSLPSSLYIYLFLSSLSHLFLIYISQNSFSSMTYKYNYYMCLYTYTYIHIIYIHNILHIHNILYYNYNIIYYTIYIILYIYIYPFLSHFSLSP